MPALSCNPGYRNNTMSQLHWWQCLTLYCHRELLGRWQAENSPSSNIVNEILVVNYLKSSVVSLVVTPRDRLHCCSPGFQHPLTSQRLSLLLCSGVLCHKLWAGDLPTSEQQSCMVTTAALNPTSFANQTKETFSPLQWGTVKTHHAQGGQAAGGTEILQLVWRKCEWKYVRVRDRKSNRSRGKRMVCIANQGCNWLH